MNTKSLTIMGVIAVMLIVVALLVSKDHEPEQTQTGRPVFQGLMAKINDVAELVVKAQSGTITIVKIGEAWAVKEKHSYSANVSKVREALLGLGELKTVEAKTKKPELYEKLGLEDVDAEGSMSTGVTLKDSAGTTLADVIVGTQRPSKGTPGQDEVFIRKPDDPQTWLAQGKFSVEKTPSEWLDKDFLEIEPNRVRSIHITHPDKTKLILEKQNPDDSDFTWLNLPKGKEVQSKFAVNNVASTVTSLSLDDVIPSSEMYFEDRAVVSATFETFDGLKGTVKLLRKDEKDYVKVSATFNAALIWKPEPKEPAEAEKPIKGEEAEDKEKKEVAKPKEPKIKPEAEVKTEIESLNQKVKDWVYIIPKFRADTILKKPEDLIKKP